MSGDAEMDARDLLMRCWQAALDAAKPHRIVPPALPPLPKGRTIIIGAGKAAASMAAAVESHWSGPLEGLVVTRYGHAVPCRRIEVIEAAHPIPDAGGTAAALRMLDMVRGLGPDDLVLCLMSGGASALMALPAPGLTLADKRQVTAALLTSGATIAEINTVRRHLSAIKGGRLAAAAWPAKIVTLAISDVPGDDPVVIGSGPTVADPTSLADARAVLNKYRIDVPSAVRDHLFRAEEETPKPGDPRLGNGEYHLIARPVASLRAAADVAAAAGINSLILGDALEGEAREVGRTHAGIALSVRHHHLPAPAPLLLLSGGETTVTVRGHGRGGRNAEFLLGFGLGVGETPGLHALACDTDGIDGTEDNAGAFWAPDTLPRARAQNLDPAQMLANNDAYGLFDALDRLIETGPTLTNVNDFRAILVSAKA